MTGRAVPVSVAYNFLPHQILAEEAHMLDWSYSGSKQKMPMTGHEQGGMLHFPGMWCRVC